MDSTALSWRKASASAENGGCVELAPLPDGNIGLRDSKNPDDAMLIFTRKEIAAWLHGARAGEFDDLA